MIEFNFCFNNRQAEQLYIKSIDVLQPYIIEGQIVSASMARRILFRDMYESGFFSFLHILIAEGLAPKQAIHWTCPSVEKEYKPGIPPKTYAEHENIDPCDFLEELDISPVRCVDARFADAHALN